MATQTHPQSLAAKTFVIVGVAVTALVGIYFLYSIRAFLLQLFVALILALALTPFVQQLKRIGFRHGLASVTAMFTTLIILLIVTTAIATPLVTQGSKLIDNAPQIVDSISTNSQLQSLEERYNLSTRARQFAEEAPEKLTGSDSPVFGAVSGVLGAVSSAVVILVLAFFLLLEGPKSWRRFLALLDPVQAERFDRTGKKVALAVRGFVAGNLFIGLLAGTTSLIIMLVLGVPYAFALAALVCLLGLIPLIGATIATVILGLVALTQGWVTALIVVILMQIYQLLENNFIQPMVYSRTVSLSPLLVLIASIVGAHLAGIVGILLAIPVAASLQIIIIEFLIHSHRFNSKRSVEA